MPFFGGERYCLMVNQRAFTEPSLETCHRVESVSAGRLLADWARSSLWLGLGTRCGAIGCASTAQITSGGRTHPRRLLVELGSLRASEPGNRPGWSLAIKPTYGG